MLDFLKDKPFKCFVGEYEDRQILSRSYKGVKAIDVNRIVGTVGRCHDDNSNWQDLKINSRFKGIKRAIEEMEKMPPIKVYKVEDEYYIVDGHHRVMASRDINRHFIDAEIIEYKFKESKDTANKRYQDCPMKDFNERTGLRGIILKSKEAYDKLISTILDFGQDMGDNYSLPDVSSRWYEEKFLDNNDKES